MTLEQYRNRTISIQARIAFTYALNDLIIDELMELMNYEYNHYADECEKKALQTVIDTLDLIMTNPGILKLSMHDLLKIIQYHYIYGTPYCAMLRKFTNSNRPDNILMHRIYNRIKQSMNEMTNVLKVRESINDKQRKIKEIDNDMKSLRAVDTSAVRIENKSNKNGLLVLIDKKENLQYDIIYLNKWIDEFKRNNKLIRDFLIQMDASDKYLIRDKDFEIAKPIIIKYMDKFISEC